MEIIILLLFIVVLHPKERTIERKKRLRNEGKGIILKIFKIFLIDALENGEVVQFDSRINYEV
jgi:hypothetical protein